MAPRTYTLPPTISHKQGDTFDWVILAELEDGTFPDLTGWTATSQVRNREGGLVEELTFEWLDITEGHMRIYSGIDTSEWPVDSLSVDIQFITAEGNKVSSDTAKILVGGDNTQ